MAAGSGLSRSSVGLISGHCTLERSRCLIWSQFFCWNFLWVSFQKVPFLLEKAPEALETRWLEGKVMDLSSC